MIVVRLLTNAVLYLRLMSCDELFCGSFVNKEREREMRSAFEKEDAAGKEEKIKTKEICRARSRSN